MPKRRAKTPRETPAPRSWPDFEDRRWGLAARLPRWRAFDGRRSLVALDWTRSPGERHGGPA